MFVYMSKKIAIPKQSVVNCLSWNHSSGYIAVGGDDGMLKVLKLASGGAGNLSMNLSLEGHTGQLQVATWNEVHQKLTTSDQHGVIIVWMLYKGSWYEEMINNRNKSIVRGMAWGSDGQKICIAYEDGAVIVGSVDGSRVWGKDIKGPGLRAVQWSPDNSLLLFALSNGELHLYDSLGNFAMQVAVQCASQTMDVVGLDWYAGKAPIDRPVLALCYSDGHIQLMKSYNDEGVILVDSGMRALDCRWNHNGATLAVAGVTKEAANTVQFFNAYGEHLRTLKVPSGSMRAISWEARSLRLAIAVDSFVYFANVKPDHRRAFYDNTLAFCSGADNVTFWEMTTHQTWMKTIPGVVDMCGAGEYCVVATSDTLVIPNQQGIQCDAKTLSIPISHVAINSQGIVVAASKDNFVIWKFATPTRPAAPEQMYRADGTVAQGGDAAASEDCVVCVCCSDTQLLVGRESGLIVVFSLLTFKKTTQLNVPARPYKMGLNSNSSKFFVIDTSGAVFLLDTELSHNISVGQPLKKDVWCALWASDNPHLLAVAEKARLYIFRDTEPEEPLPVQGYICHFKDLETTSVLLDELSDKCGPQYVVRLQVKSLRDTRQLLDKVGLADAETFIQDNPHPHLWLLLAEAALKKLDAPGALETAEAAFVRRADYAGVKFVRRLQALHSPALRRAETLAYFKDFDGAEKIYLEEDRRDLAIELRRRMGHWFRVVELLKMSANTTEAEITRVYSDIGDYYIDRQNWTNAVEYYKMAKSTEGLIKCYTALEDIKSLASLSGGTPRKTKDSSITADSYDYSHQPPSMSAIVQLTETAKKLQAAAMALQLASAEAAKKEDPLKLKKLYIMAGHLYSQNSVDGEKNKEAIRCYRLAGAQHWLAMATARALTRPARADHAMRAASRLETVVHHLHPNQQLEAWCTVALVSAEARAFATCSRAFVKLEALETNDTFKNLAIDIFTRHSPKDHRGNRVECPKCQNPLSDWSCRCEGCESEFPACFATGRPLLSSDTVWRCRVCACSAAKQDLVLRQSCPLCHSPLT